MVIDEPETSLWDALGISRDEIVEPVSDAVWESAVEVATNPDTAPVGEDYVPSLGLDSAGDADTSLDDLDLDVDIDDSPPAADAQPEDHNFGAFDHHDDHTIVHDDSTGDYAT